MENVLQSGNVPTAPIEKFLSVKQLLQQVKDIDLLSKFLVGEVNALLNKHLIEINESKLTPKNIAVLINLISDGTISGKIAKTVLDETWESGKNPKKIIEKQGLTQISDDEEIQAIIQNLFDQNPGQVAAYKSGKDKLFGFFVGQVMKASHGKANPQSVNNILKKMLAD